MDKKLDIDAVIAEIRRVAAERPDVCKGNGFDACIYFHPHTLEPVCLVGQGMAPQMSQEQRERFVDEESSPYNKVNEMTIDRVQAEHDVFGEIDENKLGWLRIAQQKQDYGETWSTAVALADERYPI